MKCLLNEERKAYLESKGFQLLQLGENTYKAAAPKRFEHCLFNYDLQNDEFLVKWSGLGFITTNLASAIHEELHESIQIISHLSNIKMIKSEEIIEEIGEFKDIEE